MNWLGNFGRGPSEKHLSEIILNLSQQSRSRCSLKNFLFLALVVILFGGPDPLKRALQGTIV